MKFAGVDFHKHTITIVVMDASRKVLTRRRFANLLAEPIVEFLRSNGEFNLAALASVRYEWFVRLVEPLARRVILAHPGKSRIIAESTRKSDKMDAASRPKCGGSTKNLWASLLPPVGEFELTARPLRHSGRVRSQADTASSGSSGGLCGVI